MADHEGGQTGDIQLTVFDGLSRDKPVKLYDLTHPIRGGMTAYPGDPPVRIEPWPDAAPWQVSAVCLGSHTGTHIDAPRHIGPTGRPLSDFPIDSFAGPGIILDAAGARESQPLVPDLLSQRPGAMAPGTIVLIRTGWDRYWTDDQYFRHPFIGAGLAESLARHGVKLVGIDTLSIDSSIDGGSAAHRALLGANILVVENLCRLTRLSPSATYEFLFAPLALDQSDGAPVRALARETDESKEQLAH